MCGELQSLIHSNLSKTTGTFSQSPLETNFSTSKYKCNNKRVGLHRPACPNHLHHVYYVSGIVANFLYTSVHLFVPRTQ